MTALQWKDSYDSIGEVCTSPDVIKQLYRIRMHPFHRNAKR